MENGFGKVENKIPTEYLEKLRNSFVKQDKQEFLEEYKYKGSNRTDMGTSEQL